MSNPRSSEPVRPGHCRSCGATGLSVVADFGAMPASDRFRRPDEPDPRWPLALMFCPHCSLAQLRQVPAPEELFGTGYYYLSSVSTTILTEAEANARDLIARYGLGPASRVVEIACNDGYLLRQFAADGIAVLGIEPSAVPAAAARALGIAVIEAFFDPELGRRIADEGGHANLVIANNVVAHVPDPNEMVAGMAALAGPVGRVAVEVHWLADLIAGFQFDTIYHEHACYFSATSAAALFARHGLRLVDVSHIALQGGSLRLHFAAGGEPSPNVAAVLEREARAGIRDGSALTAFASSMAATIAELRGAIAEHAGAGRRIAAYGAAAKGTMLLNHIGAGPETIQFVADRNPYKHGRLVPGVGIPIVPVEALFAARPDIVLVLPWNLRDEILAVLDPLRRGGSRIIVPLPRMEIV